MSEQPLDLRRFLQILRRRKLAVLSATLVGLLAGLAFTALKPPLLASDSLVVLPPAAARSVGTQVVVAASEPVLRAASDKLQPPVSLQTLRSHVAARRLTSDIIEITARAKTAGQAMTIATVVADSYVDYLGTKRSAVGKVRARVLGTASRATGTPLYVAMTLTGGLGVLPGALIGVIIALALSGGDRRLRTRDELADAIGVPVLASLAVARPSSPAGWTRLLEEYRPEAAQAWTMRKALHRLGLTDVSPGGGVRLTVVSLASDRSAVAVGPQLAIYAAGLGLPTELLIGPQQDINVIATLRAACAAQPPPNSSRPANLRVAVSDRGSVERRAGAVLSVAVEVVDDQAPRMADAAAAVTVLAVSAGAVTSEQLARVAAGAAAADREIAGIFVADPDPDDETTGRLPMLARLERRMQPSRLAGVSLESRR